MSIEVVQGILIPFAGTSLGAACVFFMQRTLRPIVQRALTGFAAGVMVAASIRCIRTPAKRTGEKAVGTADGQHFPVLCGCVTDAAASAAGILQAPNTSTGWNGGVDDAAAFRSIYGIAECMDANGHDRTIGTSVSCRARQNIFFHFFD